MNQLYTQQQKVANKMGAKGSRNAGFSKAGDPVSATLKGQVLRGNKGKHGNTYPFKSQKASGN